MGIAGKGSHGGGAFKGALKTVGGFMRGKRTGNIPGQGKPLELKDRKAQKLTMCSGDNTETGMSCPHWGMGTGSTARVGRTLGAVLYLVRQEACPGSFHVAK